MFKKIIICLLVLAMAGSAFGKLTPKQAWKKSLGGNFSLPFAGTSTYRDAVPDGVWEIREGDLWWDTDNDVLYAYDGSSWIAMNSQGGADYLFLTPGTQPSNEEGTLYYDAGTDNLIYRNASAWVTLATSTSGTLDEAYNQGTGITVDNGTITFTAPDADNNDVLALVQVDATGGTSVLTLTSAGTGALLEFDSNSSGGDIKGSDGDWTISKDGAAVFVGITTTGQINIDSADVHFDSSSADEDMLWDDNIFTLGLYDTVILGFGNTTVTPDFWFVYDGTDFNLNATTVNDDYKMGENIHFDLSIMCETNTNYFKFDTDDSAKVLIFKGTDAQFMDGDFIVLGDDKDFTITSDSTAVLKIASLATDESPIIHIGADQAGVDVRFYPDSTGEYMEWDAGNEALEFVNANIHLDDASTLIIGTDSDFVISSAADGVLVIAPDAIGNEIRFGTDETDAVIITWFSDTSGNHVTFDEENQMVEFEDVILALGDSTPIILGDTIGTGVFSISSVSSVLTYLQVSANTGEITYGVSGTDIPTKWFAEQADDWIYFNADELEFEDVVLQLMDDTEIQLGDDDDVILRYDETTDNNFEIVVASSGMSIVTNDFIITTDGVAADQIKLYATGTHSSPVIVLQTTNGQIEIDADGSGNGDILINAADNIEFTAAGDMNFTVTGNIRVVDDDLFGFGTDDDVVFNYDADGESNLQIKGPLDIETTYVQFREEPIAMKKNSESLPTGAAGDENLLLVGYPLCLFEYHVIGTATDIVPELGAVGLDIGLDDDNNDGLELTEGITARSRSAFVSGTHDFYLEVIFYVNDADGSDDIRMGFRSVQAYDATIDNYDEMQAVGLKGADWYGFTINADGGTAETDITPVSGDVGDGGETFTVRVSINQDLSTDWSIDGAEPTSFPDTDVETGITFIPFFYYIHDTNVSETLQIISWECGLQ